MNTTIDPKLLENHVTHQNNMGPWAVVQDAGDGYVRVCGISRTGEVGSEAYLAWLPMLSPFMHRPVGAPKDSPLVPMLFTEEQMAGLNAVRDDLAAGKKRVVFGHIVPA